MKKLIIPAAMLALLITGCVSTSTGDLGATAGNLNSATVSISTPAGSRSVLYIPKLAAALASNGFIVTTKGQSAEYSAELVMDAGPWAVKCTITLSRHGRPIISASSLNPGFGNWLNRQASIDAVADAAIVEFNNKLARR
jgi:hypothetical protein